jgi:hypothetical protein
LGNTYFTETVRTVGVPLKIGGGICPFRLWVSESTFKPI